MKSKRTAVAAAVVALATSLAGASLADHGSRARPVAAQDIAAATAGFYGSTGGMRLSSPVVGMAATPSGRGYWLVAADGGIFSFGDARFYGSTGGVRLSSPVVGMAATPSGAGYWLVARDGGIFSFGDARFYGSTGGVRLSSPVVGMAATPSGRGYRLVAADGGIFSFGDARFYGSTGGVRLSSPVVGMAGTASGAGYWLVAADGGIFSFGDARFYGSTGGMRLASPVVGMAATGSGAGYWLVARDGGIFSFGNAPFEGSAGGAPLAQPVVGMATSSQVTGYWLVASDGGIFSYPAASSSSPAHFSTLPVGAALPSDATCASEVRPAAEVRPANNTANHTKGVGANTEYPRVDGNYTGTTDQILQWAACKWGIDEDIVRAEAAIESYWFQRTVSDFSTDPTTCVPGHQTLGADGTPGECPQSIGILQVRYPYHQSAFQNNNATNSTAYNIDYMYAVWRQCYEGGDQWLNTVDRGATYSAGDVWGCVGVWYSGRWYTSAAVDYINRVKADLAQRIWETASFKSAT